MSCKYQKVKVNPILFAFGIKPTHLDPHMNGLFGSLDFFKAYFSIGKEYKIPVLVPMKLLQDSGFRKVAGDYPALVVSHLVNVKPGLNELVLHLAYNDEDMKAVTIGKTHWWDAA